MILNQGRNRIRDLIRDAVGTVAIGSGTTTETGADTGLETQVAEKPASVFDGATGEFRARGRLTSAENNGDSLTEAGATIGGDLISRTTHSPLAKSSLIEAEYEIVYKVVEL